MANLRMTQKLKDFISDSKEWDAVLHSAQEFHKDMEQLRSLGVTLEDNDGNTISFTKKTNDPKLIKTLKDVHGFWEEDDSGKPIDLEKVKT